MMTSFRRTVGMTVLLTLLLVLTGFQLVFAQDNVFRMGIHIEPGNFDPHYTTDRSHLVQIRNIYEPLVEPHPTTLEPQPVLATSWDISDDGLTYRFDLRRGVQFSDGEPFNALAAKKSIERMIDMGTGTRIAVNRIKTVKVVDEYTLEIVLSEPFQPFLQALWVVWMVSPKAVEENEQDGDFAHAWLQHNTAGTGPYKLDEWLPGEKYTLTKNPNYWGGWDKPHFDKVELLNITEPGTQTLMLQRGDLDLALAFPLSELRSLARNPDIELVQNQSLEFNYVMLQYAGGATADPLVRQAIAHAIDPSVVVDLSEGMIEPASSLIPSELVGGDAPSTMYDYNPERARQLLKEAGYDQLSLKLSYNVPDSRKDMIAEVLQFQLQAVGIDLSIETDSWPALRAKLVRYAETGDPAFETDMVLMQTGSKVGSGGEVLWSLFHTDSQAGAGINLMNYSHPLVDRLIDDSLQEVDPEAYIPMQREAMDIIVEETPYIVLGRTLEFLPMRANIGGFQPRRVTTRYVYYYDLHRK